MFSTLDTIDSEPVTWLWEARIPRGKLTILDGNPGLGKTFAALDLAARVTTGSPMPDGSPGVSGGVVFLSLEDDPGDTLRPRLEAAGADLARVTVLDPASPMFPNVSEIKTLENLIGSTGAALLVLDPLVGFLPADCNAHRDQDIRRALTPLSMLAQRTECAIVGIRHLNKSTAGQAIHRGGGSIGIGGAARCVLLVAEDPDDSERRVLASIKCNLAPRPDALCFRVAGEPARLSWEGVSTHTADALVAPMDGEERSALDDARAFIREELDGGERPAREILSAARSSGVAEKTLKRAKRLEGVSSRRVNGAWIWTLPRGPVAPNPHDGPLGPLGPLGSQGGLAVGLGKGAKGANEVSRSTDPLASDDEEGEDIAEQLAREARAAANQAIAARGGIRGAR